MTITTAPIINPHPDPDLIAALAGDDLMPCRTCNGSGSIRVGTGRGQQLTCPMCRGAKVRPYPAPASEPF